MRPDKFIYVRDVDRLLTREDRAAMLTALGFKDGLGRKIRADDANRDGWLSGLYLPPEIKRDANASASAHLDSGAIVDMGSTFRGDLYDAVQSVLGVGFYAATQWVLAFAGRRINGLFQEQVYEHAQTKDAMSLPTITVTEVHAYTKQLLSHERFAPLREYLTETRGLTPETIQKNLLGAMDLWGDMWLVIPYQSERTGGVQTVTAYKLMAYNPDTRTWVEENGKKVRTKGSALLYPTTGTQAKPIVLCEGEIDVLTLRQIGVNALTSTAGASTFYTRFASEVLDYSDSVFLAYDGDEAGREGAKNTSRLLAGEGAKRLRVVDMPEGHDVNSLYVEHGKDAVLSVIAQATEVDPSKLISETKPRRSLTLKKMLEYADASWGQHSREERGEALRMITRILARENMLVVPMHMQETPTQETPQKQAA